MERVKQTETDVWKGNHWSKSGSLCVVSNMVAAEAPSVAVTPNLCWISQSNLTASVLAAAHIQQDCSSPSLLQLWQSSSTPVESDEYQPLFVHRTFNSSALRDKVHGLTGLSCHWTGSNWPPGSASFQPCFDSLLYWLKMTMIQL